MECGYRCSAAALTSSSISPSNSGPCQSWLVIKRSHSGESVLLSSGCWSDPWLEPPCPSPRQPPPPAPVGLLPVAGDGARGTTRFLLWLLALPSLSHHPGGWRTSWEGAAPAHGLSSRMSPGHRLPPLCRLFWPPSVTQHGCSSEWGVSTSVAP